MLRSPAASRCSEVRVAGAAARAGEVREAGRAVGQRAAVAVGRDRVDEGQRDDRAVDRIERDRRAARRPADQVRAAARCRARAPARARRRPSRAGRGSPRSAAARCRRTRACRAPAGGSAPARRRSRCSKKRPVDRLPWTSTTGMPSSRTGLDELDRGAVRCRRVRSRMIASAYMQPFRERLRGGKAYPMLELVRDTPDWLAALGVALTRPPGVPERRGDEDPWQPEGAEARPRRIADDLAWLRQAFDEPENNGLQPAARVRRRRGLGSRRPTCAEPPRPPAGPPGARRRRLPAARGDDPALI